jgi:hypothetical protein
VSLTQREHEEIRRLITNKDQEIGDLKQRLNANRDKVRDSDMTYSQLRD